MANLEQKTEHIDYMQYLNPEDLGKVTLNNANWMVNEIPENDKRKVVNTEKYVDDYGRTMTKRVYEDGSWSVSLEGMEPRYDYTEYYPNGKKKFEYSSAPYEWYHYAIYNQDGKLLYWKYTWWTRETDSASGEEDKYFKYDEKGRLIEDKVDNVEYQYNDIEKKVIVTNYVYNGTAKHVVTYKMDDSGNIDFYSILSNKFIGETGAEINLKKGWLENLIENMAMENIPHIYDY